MKKIIVLVAVAAGALVFWRRRSASQDPWAQATDSV